MLVISFYISHSKLAYSKFRSFSKDVEDWFGYGKLNIFVM